MPVGPGSIGVPDTVNLDGVVTGDALPRAHRLHSAAGQKLVLDRLGRKMTTSATPPRRAPCRRGRTGPIPAGGWTTPVVVAALDASPLDCYPSISLPYAGSGSVDLDPAPEGNVSGDLTCRGRGIGVGPGDILTGGPGGVEGCSGDAQTHRLVRAAPAALSRDIAAPRAASPVRSRDRPQPTRPRAPKARAQTRDRQGPGCPAP